MQYSIHEDNMEKLTLKLSRIEKKCNKYNCTFNYAIVGEEYKNIQHEKEVIGAYGIKSAIKTFITVERFVIVEVEGIAKVNDWKFTATLEHTENGNIIRQYDTESEIPEYYRTCKPICEHCNINRIRRDTYIIQNVVSKEYKQVGKSCLKDFTGGLSAEVVAQYLSYFETLQTMDCHESQGGFTRRYINVFDYITAVIEVVNKCGFISKAKSEEEQKEPTSSKTYGLMHPFSKYDYEEIDKLDFVADRKENKESATKMLEWIEKQDPTSQYISNLQIVCKKEYAEFRDLGIIASLPSAYFKSLETEKERIKRESRKTGSKQSQYVGSISDKIELTNVTITRIAQYETQYGFTTIFKIIDSEENIYIWKSSSSYKNDVPIEEFINIKGTIKAHNEYKGELQTELTRCKVS